MMHNQFMTVSMSLKIVMMLLSYIQFNTKVLTNHLQTELCVARTFVCVIILVDNIVLFLPISSL